jgi:tRNA(Ile)-lysidine synthase
MATLVDRVRQLVREHDLFDRESRVLAAVSGGSDSVALAHLLRELDAAGEVTLVGIAHFNHQLRVSADDDERFVAGVAESLGRPIVIDRADVAARARRERRSVEDAGRAARYEFFERACVSAGADLVALGHTRDDQAETFLLRLLRGAGPRGLASMYPRNGRVVRPLLGCRREELREWIDAQHLAFVEDETNADVSIPRNRVRAELLPLLRARFNPNIVDVLADEADVARGGWEWMDAVVADLSARVVRPGAAQAAEPVLEIEVAALTAAPLALQRAVIWHAMSEVAGGRPVSFNHVEAARRLKRDECMDAPGQRLERIGPRLVLRGRTEEAARNRPGALKAPNLFRYPLSIPGEVEVPDTGCIVSAEAVAASDAEDGGAIVRNYPDGQAALIRGDLCGQSLVVRNRRPGDRFRPVGLGGQKKLQDYFVDRKVARAHRDTVPLVVDETDRIVWVAGHGIDEAFRVTDPAQAVLILKLRQL